MVGVAQLAERLVVVQEVAGSTPVVHPECSRFELLFKVLLGEGSDLELFNG